MTAAALSPFWVFTASGIPFDFDGPRPEMISETDLAWQLSGEGRWANNTHFPLSVAQHSIAVALAIPRAEWRIYGLLHDAAEAYTRDLPTPFKHWLLKHGADVPALERRILTDAVLPHFSLAPPDLEIMVAVDLADARALATEYRDVVQGKGPEWVPAATPFKAPVKYRQRHRVQEDFLKHLHAMQRDAFKAGFRAVGRTDALPAAGRTEQSKGRAA